MLPFSRQVQAHDRTQARAIHIAHVGQVEHHTLGFRDQIADRRLQSARGARIDSASAADDGLLRTSYRLQTQFWDWDRIRGHDRPPSLGWNLQLTGSLK